MKISFKLPFDCYISGPSKESLNLQATFEESGYSVNLAIPMEDSEVMELKNVSKVNTYFISIKNIRFELTPTSGENAPQFDYASLKSDKTKQKSILELFVKIANRALIAIRNFGMVPHIQIVNPDNSNPEKYLSLWGAKILENDTENDISPVTNLLGMAIAGYWGGKQNTPDLHVYRWPDIEEALQDQTAPPPEKEFFTNAVEFIRAGNFRMALLESIICLEIVLTQYLKSFLRIKKSIPDKRIKMFLKPEVGLTAKISVMLDLSLDKGDLEDVDINKVIRAISWRNNIIHKTGRLPVNPQEEELRDCISHVLVLSQILARKRVQIESEPDLQAMAKEVAENNSIPLPSIWPIGRHFYSISINFLFQAIPEKSTLEKVANELIEKLKKYDNRIDSNKHLFIRFLQFPDKVRARWRNGALEILEEDKLVMPNGQEKT